MADPGPAIAEGSIEDKHNGQALGWDEVLLTSEDGDSRVLFQGDDVSVSFKKDNVWKVWRKGDVTERCDCGDYHLRFTIRKGSLTEDHHEVITVDGHNKTFSGGWTEE